MALTRLSAATLVLALAACSGDDDGTDNVKIDSFTATPLTVASGATTNLSWTTSNATKITITANPGGELVNTTDASGSATSAALTANTVFTMTADGAGGPVTRTLTIMVTTNNDMPMVSSFTASPATIAPNGMATLTWTTVNADSVTITAGGATVVDAGAANGNTMVMPADTTIYTLVATGAGGTAMATVTVNVSQDPIVTSFSATPNTIDPGDSSTLAWVVVNATNVTITDSNGAEVYNDTGLTGNVMVMPAATTSYTLIATNANGTASMTTMVTVNPPTGPNIASFTANPTTVDLGNPSTLSWTVMNATSITITDGAASSTTTTNLTGTWAVRPAANATYTLTATDGTNTVMAQVTIMVNAAAPAVISFNANPNPVARGASTTLSFEVVGADTVRILQGGTAIYNGTAGTGTATTAAITTPSEVFTLEATNALGSNTANVTVYSHAAPTINDFSVTPMTFQGTTTATVTYDVSSTVMLALYVNGMLDTGFTGVGTGTTAVDGTGSYSISISASTTFRLVAMSAGGQAEATVSATQVVIEAEPNDDLATASPFPTNGNSVQGMISPADDEDWYSIVVQDGYSVRAETSDGMGGCTTDTILTLTSTDGQTILASNDDKNGSANRCSLIDPRTSAGAAALPAGTYFLIVSGFDTETGPYVLDVQITAPACGNGILDGTDVCDDGNLTNGDGCDANCALEVTATYTAPGAPMTFTASVAVGEFRTYEITATAETYIRGETFSNATAGTCSVDTRLTLLDAQGQPLGTDDLDGVASCSLLDPTFDAWVRVPAGTYYVIASEDGLNAAIYYELVLEGLVVDICGNGVVDGQDQCDDGNTVANDGCSPTCQLETVGTFVATNNANMTFAGNALAVGQVDTYLVQVPTGGDVYLRVETFADSMAGTCAGTDTVLRLLDNTGAQLGTNDEGGVGSCSLIDYTAAYARLSGGTDYFVTVEDYLLNTAIPNYDVVFDALAADVCGNGFLEAGEDCDDGNTTGGDACPANCTIVVSNTLMGSSSPGTAIPDNMPTGITDTITLAATPACTVASVSVDINIPHTYRGDIQLDLTSPSGTTVRLKNIAFENVPDVIGNFPMTLTPAGNLADFAGDAGNGTWTLFVSDNYFGDTGTLNSWGVNVGCQ